METQIQIRKIKRKKIDPITELIQEGDESKLAEALSKVEGVRDVQILEGCLDIITFPIGYAVRGEYDPSRLSQAICSNGYSILKVRIRR